MNNFKQYLRLAKNKLIERLLVLISLLSLANLVFFPVPASAEMENSDVNPDIISVNYQLVPEDQGNNLIQVINPEVILNGSDQYKSSHLPQNKGLEAKYAINAVITAYNSDIGQTDDSPCITASGFDVCKHNQEDTVAINGYKMGTKVRFPDLFGDRVFVVRDRMNSRFGSSRVDVWMLSRVDAKNFGVKETRMEVLE
jgi:3D (Asp-Asp-Asp) domain-containing protein